MRLKITLLLFIGTICMYQIKAQCSGADFEDKNGIAILEMEAKASGSWKKESISGASANSALVYRGTNSFSSPGKSTTTYNVKINSAGTYRFIWRNKIGVIASHNPSTEHNDTWLKINASNFFGKKGSSKVYPGGSGKSPVAAGATSGGWFKIYTNTIGWSWSTQTSDHNPHAVYATFNSAGVYSIQISGRSNGHIVDRMVLYKEGSYSASQAQSLSRAVTNCSGGGTPPPPPPPTGSNNAPSVSITSPSNGQNFNVGSTVTVGLSANDSDGSIVKHEIFVNNTKVDTDGSSYSPYKLSNIQSGSYAITVKVTDNGGKTASKTVNITVGGTTTPPPPPPPSGTNAAPSVSFTNLSAGQNFNVGSNVSVKLSSSDSDGSVVKHRIYVNNKLVDTDGSNYTAHVISQIQSGNYTIKATVTDDDGANTSTSVVISVGGVTPPPSNGNTSPTVSFTTITNGQQVAVGSTVSVGVSANDSDGSIVQHKIYVNNKLVDTDGSNFTAHKITGIKAGNYAIKVVVTDNKGATGSATVNIVAGSGTPPPTSNAISFDLINASTNNVIAAISNGATVGSSKAQGINIRANAPTGTKSVKLILSGAQSQTRTESVAPYAVFGDISGNYSSNNLKNGSYTLKATAYSGSSASGSVVSSTTISFTVSGSASGKTAYAYPNPVKADGKVSLKLPTGGQGNYQYYISSSTGTLIDKGTFNATSSKTDVNLQLTNVGGQVEGVYYLTLISNNSKQVIPIIRE